MPTKFSAVASETTNDRGDLPNDSASPLKLLRMYLFEKSVAADETYQMMSEAIAMEL